MPLIKTVTILLDYKTFVSTCWGEHTALFYNWFILLNMLSSSCNNLAYIIGFNSSITELQFIFSLHNDTHVRIITHMYIVDFLSPLL